MAWASRPDGFIVFWAESLKDDRGVSYAFFAAVGKFTFHYIIAVCMRQQNPFRFAQVLCRCDSCCRRAGPAGTIIFQSGFKGFLPLHFQSQINKKRTEAFNNKLLGILAKNELDFQREFIEKFVFFIAGSDLFIIIESFQNAFW